MADRLSKCPACGGLGYFRCDCWPGDCICEYGDENCDECGGDGFIDPADEQSCYWPDDNPSPAPPSQDLMGIPALTDDQVEAVLHLVESRLCIIWAKVGAREAFAKELRVMEPAPDDEEEICEACGEAFEEGDLVYWSSDDTGHLHADCCGPEREGYVNPDGSPLADGDPIPQPFAYKPPSKTIKRLATATEGSGDAD